MTQAPPSPVAGQKAPPVGYPAAPVTIALGATSTIPYPDNISTGPVPPVLPWVVILNSSPYTLRVKQGADLRPIAAFTSDLVQVMQLGQPQGVEITPDPGAGIIAPGSDSTAYATWYSEKPPGSWPASTGAGAAQFLFGTNIVFSDGLAHGIVNGTPSVFPGTPAPCANFGAARVIVDNVGNVALGPATCTLRWYDQLGNVILQRKFVVPGSSISGQAGFVTPHVGEAFDLVIEALGSAACIVTVAIFQQSSPLAAWLIDPGAFGPTFTPPTTPGLLVEGTASVVNGATTTLAESTNVFAGPGAIYVDGQAAAAALGYSTTLEAQNPDASWSPIGKWGFGKTQNGLLNEQVMLPPAPLRVRATNASGGTHDFATTVIPDAWRCAA